MYALPLYCMDEDTAIHGDDNCTGTYIIIYILYSATDKIVISMVIREKKDSIYYSNSPNSSDGSDTPVI